MEFKHKPVLLEETIEGLKIKEDGIYVDGTLGGAGHSKEILKRLSSKGMLIGIDRDEEALKAAKENLKQYSNVKYVHGNHDEIEEILKKLNIEDNGKIRILSKEDLEELEVTEIKQEKDFVINYETEEVYYLDGYKTDDNNIVYSLTDISNLVVK